MYLEIYNIFNIYLAAVFWILLGVYTMTKNTNMQVLCGFVAITNLLLAVIIPPTW